MMRLFDYEYSAECYKVRLLLSILEIDHEIVPVDVHPGRENESAEFLALNVLGEVPVFVSDELILRGANAILVWLARRFDPEAKWLPNEPMPAAVCQGWLTIADRLAAGVGTARMTLSRGETLPDKRAISEAHRLLRAVDEHLWFAERRGDDWLAPLPHPTLAEIACFPDIALCEEAGVSRIDYPAIRRWMDRVRRIERFTLMSGIFPASPPAPRTPVNQTQTESLS